MIIKITSINSLLHENESFNKYNDSFLTDIENSIETKLIDSNIDDYNCDLKLIYISSGGSEGIFLKNIDKIKEPVYLLTSGNNNSLAASIEILTYLNLNNIKGEIIHGNTDYISNRILNLVKDNTKTFNRRLGVIGTPSDWLIASIPNYEKIKEKFGYELINIPIDKVKQFYDKSLSFENIDLPFEYDLNEKSKSLRIYKALEAIKNSYNLDGLTIRCFDLLTLLKTTSCIALAKLNDQGITSTCEGDIMSLVSMQLVYDLFKMPSFQANPSRIDITKNQITFAHCTIPFSMVNNVKLKTHYESNIGIGIQGKLDLSDVTILRISSNLKDYFVSEGKIIDNLEEENLCRTQIVVEMNDDVSKLLKSPCGNHHIIFYGKHKDRIVKYLSNL